MNSRHDDRRREVGKMFFDIAKYLATAALVGNLFTHNMSPNDSLIVLATVSAITVAAFIIVPTKKGD